MSSIIERMDASQITKQDAEPLAWMVFALRFMFRHLPSGWEDRVRDGLICIEILASTLAVLEHANRLLAENDGLSIAAPE